MYCLFLHGKELFGKSHGDEHGANSDYDEAHHGLEPGKNPHESPLVVTLPLILLAIPSLVIGFYTIEPLLAGNWFGKAIFVGASHAAGLKEIAESLHGGAVGMALHGLMSAPFWLALAGVVTAWVFYMYRPGLPAVIRSRFEPVYTVLDNKYYFDRFNEIVFAGGARLLGKGLWRAGDQGVIDGFGVTGSSRLVRLASRILSLFQTGHLYQYAFTMIVGVCILLTFWVSLS
ncbi:MAG: NADH-quinone oxidoreductase subunit L, partial [Azoarcus sp.]|jgi:NADH-quinone oxidoreductase subunit L|nr:NADH-quinone oxidoreductase subunit L [Azoarcus sp.]